MSRSAGMSALCCRRSSPADYSIPHFKLVKQVVAGEQLVEQASQTPYITESISAHFLPSVVEVSIHFSVATQRHHFRTLDIECAFTGGVELVHL